MWAALLSWVPSIVLRVLTALGIGFVTYQLSDTALDALISEVQTSFGAFPASVASIVALSGIDKAVSIIISAHVTALSISAARAAFGMRRTGTGTT